MHCGDFSFHESGSVEGRPQGTSSVPENTGGLTIISLLILFSIYDEMKRQIIIACLAACMRLCAACPSIVSVRQVEGSWASSPQSLAWWARGWARFWARGRPWCSPHKHGHPCPACMHAQSCQTAAQGRQCVQVGDAAYYAGQVQLPEYGYFFALLRREDAYILRWTACQY